MQKWPDALWRQIWQDEGPQWKGVVGKFQWSCAMGLGGPSPNVFKK